MAYTCLFLADERQRNESSWADQAGYGAGGGLGAAKFCREGGVADASKGRFRETVARRLLQGTRCLEREAGGSGGRRLQARAADIAGRSRVACGRVPGWNCADSTEFRQLNFGECPEVEVPADWKTLDIFWVNSGVPVSWRMSKELRRVHSIQLLVVPRLWARRTDSDELGGAPCERQVALQDTPTRVGGGPRGTQRLLLNAGGMVRRRSGWRHVPMKSRTWMDPAESHGGLAPPAEASR